MGKANSDLINVRLAEIERDHSWHELSINLKTGVILIPLAISLLAYVLNYSFKNNPPSIAYYVECVSLFSFTFVLIIMGWLLMVILKRIDKSNNKNNLRSLILKYYSITNDKNFEKAIIKDTIPNNRDLPWDYLTKKGKQYLKEELGVVLNNNKPIQYKKAIPIKYLTEKGIKNFINNISTKI